MENDNIQRPNLSTNSSKEIVAKSKQVLSGLINQQQQEQQQDSSTTTVHNFKKLSELVYEHLVNICGNKQQKNDPSLSDITLSIGSKTGQNELLSDKLKSANQLLFELFIECIKWNVKIKTLKHCLIDAEWPEPFIDAFLEFWQHYSQQSIELMKQKSFDETSNCLLKNVDRKIKLLSDHSDEHEPKLLFGELNLQLQNNSSLTLNFTHEELIRFYDQLELIQNKIDKLYNLN